MPICLSPPVTQEFARLGKKTFLTVKRSGCFYHGGAMVDDKEDYTHLTLWGKPGGSLRPGARKQNREGLRAGEQTKVPASWLNRQFGPISPSRARAMYVETQELKRFVHVDTIDRQPGRITFTGSIDRSCPRRMSPEELALLLDDGGTNFGGVCTIRPDGTFTCAIYTD